MFIRVLMVTTLLLWSNSIVIAQSSLRSDWKNGAKFTYRIDDSSEVEIGKAMRLNPRLSLDSEWEVKNVDSNGVADISVTIQRVQFEANQQNLPADWEKLQFDSSSPIKPEKKSEQSIYETLEAFVGEEITMRVDGKRELIAFDFADSLEEHLEKNVITLELAGFFGHIFTSDGMRSRITKWLVVAPPQPVSKGDSWQKEALLSGPNSPASRWKYTHDGAINRAGTTLTEIGIQTELNIQKKINTAPKTTIQTRYVGGGNAYFDEQTGLIVEATLRDQSEASSSSFATSVKTTITVKLLPMEKR